MSPQETARIEHFLKLTLKLAEENMLKGEGGPFGAIVVKDDQIVGSGFNQVTSTYDPTAHAEVQAIRDACRHLKSFQIEDCEVFASCEPCPMCLGAIYWARPKALYFASTRKDAADAGFDDDFIYQEIALTPEKRSIPTKHVYFEGHNKVFSLWKAKQDRVDY